MFAILAPLIAAAGAAAAPAAAAAVPAAAAAVPAAGAVGAGTVAAAPAAVPGIGALAKSVGKNVVMGLPKAMEESGTSDYLAELKQSGEQATQNIAPVEEPTRTELLSRAKMDAVRNIT